jgi:ADP-ribosylation factor GTPase-activating protein 2/3
MPSCKIAVLCTLRQRLTSPRYPEEVIITDLADEAGASGTSTPAGDDDDFFSSWDKPTIKRPSNPPSRTGTPGINRTNSPFLNAPANGAARPKSPLTADAAAPAPTTARAIPASAARKTAVGGAAPRKANILGAKKKLGAKKVDPAALDFDAAERKAREEAERIAKLGYDPEAEATPAEAQITSAQPDSTSSIVSPQPVSPRPGVGFGATGKAKGKQDEVEGLGVAVRKLGFGQVGGGAPAAAAPKKMGFGSTTRATEGKGSLDQTLLTKLTNSFPDDSEKYARQKFGTQKGISSDEFFGRGTFDSNSQQEAKSRLQGFEGAQSISSNAYFGRPEDEMPEGEYGDIETAAKDFVRKLGITAGDDLENLTSLLGEGTNKLQGKTDGTDELFE